MDFLKCVQNKYFIFEIYFLFLKSIFFLAIQIYQYRELNLKMQRRFKTILIIFTKYVKILHSMLKYYKIHRR